MAPGIRTRRNAGQRLGNGPDRTENALSVVLPASYLSLSAGCWAPVSAIQSLPEVDKRHRTGRCRRVAASVRNTSIDPDTSLSNDMGITQLARTVGVTHGTYSRQGISCLETGARDLLLTAWGIFLQRPIATAIRAGTKFAKQWSLVNHTHRVGLLERPTYTRSMP